MYSNEQKKAIFTQWCKYQKANKIPVSEYGYQAYTDSIYDLWLKVLANDKNGSDLK